MKTLPSPALLPALLVLSGACAGCLAIKTEHEVKPIQITMDVNVKARVNDAVQQEFEKEDSMRMLMALNKRGAIGMNSGGYIEKRGEMSEEERIFVEDFNRKLRLRMFEIAEEKGISRAQVERDLAERMLERLPAGAWYQDASGAWKRK